MRLSLRSSCRDSKLILIQFYGRHIQSDTALPPLLLMLLRKHASAYPLKSGFILHLVSRLFSQTGTFINHCQCCLYLIGGLDAQLHTPTVQAEHYEEEENVSLVRLPRFNLPFFFLYNLDVLLQDTDI